MYVCIRCYLIITVHAYISTLFAHAGHVGMQESIFHYIGGESYYLFNNHYSTFWPTFVRNQTDPPSDVFDVCRRVYDCVFDYILTRNIRIASSTYNISISTRSFISVLGNTILINKVSCECIH